MFASVKLVPVELHARTASCSAEGDFAKASDFAHHLRSLLIGDDVDFVAGLVGGAKSALRREFCLEERFVDGGYDGLHIKKLQ